MRIASRGVLRACLGVILLCAAMLAPAAAEAASAFKLLRAIPTAAESAAGSYERSEFNHWIDADGDGCDTRYEVLFRQNLRRSGTDCGATTGRWRSVYDGRVFTTSGGLDVDHVVALAEAWQSGAAKGWDAGTRERFANDLDYPRSLIAVSASSNRSKGADDPADWMPANSRYACRYVVNWIAVKYRWRLSADRAERRALRTELGKCSRKATRLPLPPRASITKSAPAPAPTPTPSPDTGGGSYPQQPDLPGDQDCSDFDTPVMVLPGDPDDLDRDGDGIGCDSN